MPTVNSAFIPLAIVLLPRATMCPELRLGRHSHHLCVSVPSALVQLTQATHLYGTELTAPPEKSRGRKLPHWHLKTGLVGGPGEWVKGQEDTWFH